VAQDDPNPTGRAGIYPQDRCRTRPAANPAFRPTHSPLSSPVSRPETVVSSGPSRELAGARDRPGIRRSRDIRVIALATAVSNPLSHTGRCTCPSTARAVVVVQRGAGIPTSAAGDDPGTGRPPQRSVARQQIDTFLLAREDGPPQLVLGGAALGSRSRGLPPRPSRPGDPAADGGGGETTNWSRPGLQCPTDVLGGWGGKADFRSASHSSRLANRWRANSRRKVCGFLASGSRAVSARARPSP